MLVPLPDLKSVGGLAYLQRFIPQQESDQAPGFDWRVMVIGGRAVAAMKRVSPHWVRNVAQRPAAWPHRSCPHSRNWPKPRRGAGHGLCRRRPRADPASPLGAQVIEVNGVAAWRGLQKVTPFDIAQAIVDDLLARRLGVPLLVGAAGQVCQIGQVSRDPRED
ncbi:hypothetical protein [Thauera humireducens]|uniref:ATP-grasp domain-containing protein n=1 Tax=Thauera humireducens TaxID=1134435 RepID=UPI00311DE41F